MRNTRKGFTLVELLIVVAILGTLAASMMVSFGNSTAKAKAASIAANIDSCITAAKLYLADNIDDVAADSTSAFLGNSTGTVYISNWGKMSTDTITYAAGEGTYSGDGWNLIVTIKAADKKAIIEAMQKITGYKSGLANISDATKDYTITVTLLDGTVEGKSATA